MPRPIRSDPLSILWHYAIGEMPDFLDKIGPPVGWVRWSHRGVHRLDNIVFPKRQERYIKSTKWETRMNQNFEAVVRNCAKPDRFGKTWIVEPLIQGLIKLREMGFAHSWESYENNQLVGGLFGLQIGGWITMSSMYNSANNAAKPALGRALLSLRDRGFEWVDRGMVPDHSVDFGVEWWPRWKYEAAIPRLLRQVKSVSDEFPCAPVPKQIFRGLPFVKIGRALRRKILGEKPDPPAPVKEEAEENG